MPEVRSLTFDDLRSALHAGYADFLATRADVIFIAVIYPLAGINPCRDGHADGYGPVAGTAGCGVLPCSGRSRPSGYTRSAASARWENDAHWLDAFGVFRSPSFGAILMPRLLSDDAVLLVWANGRSGDLCPDIGARTSGIAVSGL